MSKRQLRICLIQQMFDIAWSKHFNSGDKQSLRAVHEASQRFHIHNDGVDYLED